MAALQPAYFFSCLNETVTALSNRCCIAIALRQLSLIMSPVCPDWLTVIWLTLFWGTWVYVSMHRIKWCLDALPCYYDAGATAGSEQVVGKTSATPVGRRKWLLDASAQPLCACVVAQKRIYTPTLTCITCFQHLHTRTQCDWELECLLETGVNGNIFCAAVGTMCCQCAPNPHCQ